MDGVWAECKLRAMVVGSGGSEAKPGRGSHFWTEFFPKSIAEHGYTQLVSNKLMNTVIVAEHANEYM